MSDDPFAIANARAAKDLEGYERAFAVLRRMKKGQANLMSQRVVSDVNRFHVHGPWITDNTVAVLASDYDALAARLAEVERDAARYRWLRSQNSIMESNKFAVMERTSEFSYQRPHQLDAAIDAAMRADSATPSKENDDAV